MLTKRELLVLCIGQISEDYNLKALEFEDTKLIFKKTAEFLGFSEKEADEIRIECNEGMDALNQGLAEEYTGMTKEEIKEAIKGEKK